MPLIQVSYPTNVSYFLNLLVGFINFDLIPTDKLVKLVFRLKEDGNDTTTTVMTSIGYESSNIINNTGSIILLFGAILFIVIAVLLPLRLLK